MSWQRDQQGFTMLELLVVLTIIIILTLLTVPSFVSLLREYHVTAAGEDLLYNLQYARSEAIKRNANIYVSFSTASPWCYGINVGSACTCSTAGNCTLGAFSENSNTQAINLSATGLSSNSLVFEGTRGATTNGATVLTFTVSGQTTAMGLSVTALGDMTMCSSTIGGYPACP